MNDLVLYIVFLLNVLYFIVGGGGFLVVFLKKIEYCCVVIEDFKFLNNLVMFGGGFYFVDLNLVLKNSLLIIGLYFVRNRVG